MFHYEKMAYLETVYKFIYGNYFELMTQIEYIFYGFFPFFFLCEIRN